MGRELSLISPECSFCFTGFPSIIRIPYLLQHREECCIIMQSVLLSPCSSSRGHSATHTGIGMNVLSLRCTWASVVWRFMSNASLSAGGAVFWPRVLGSQCQLVRPCWFNHSESGWTLPLLEPLQRWQDPPFCFNIAVDYLMQLCHSKCP